MSKKMNFLFAACILMAIFFSSCSTIGNLPSFESSKSETDAPSSDNVLSIENIKWNVSEGILDEKRYVLFDYTNNSKFIISSFKITFIAKPDITEEEKTAFYSDIQKEFELKDEDFEDLKKREISMNAETERVVNPGESVKNVHCFYYSGIYYVTNINHYNLMKPDIATIKYVDQDKIHTLYYDFNSKKYSSEESVEDAFQWSEFDLSSRIPKPDVKVVQAYQDKEEKFMFDAYGMSLEQFNAYVDQCKVLGYTVNERDSEGFYTADNAEGYNVYLYYGDDDFYMSGAVEAPEKTAQ